MANLKSLPNNFFYKFYNYNLEDPTILSKIPIELYSFVTREFAFYKNNIEYSHMDSNQFGSFLFNLIKLNFTTIHEKLIKDLK